MEFHLEVVNTIFFGDILQYMPIKDQALYTPVYTDTDNTQNSKILNNEIQPKSQLHDSDTNQKSIIDQNENNPTYLEYSIGRSIWLQRKHAIILTKQMSIIDPEYTNLLARLRNFQCTKNDHEMLLSRVVGSENYDVMKYDKK